VIRGRAGIGEGGVKDYTLFSRFFSLHNNEKRCYIQYVIASSLF
jgi:hypothetical protein